MDLYTLTDTFLANETIDEFVSAIWTERYSVAGDFQLVVPATDENVTRLAEGTYLGLRGTKEVMIVETQQIEEGLLTLTGPSLLEFLNQRFLWARNPDSSAADSRIKDYTDATKKPGAFLADLVTKWAISPTAMTSSWAPANLEWTYEAIPFLTLGPVDASGDVQRLTAPTGPLYEAIVQLATKYKVGVSLYLELADPMSGYSLKFTTYQGKDRTSDQEVYPLVRLTPELDGLNKIKEIRSLANYKNVVYVYYQGEISKHLAEPSLPEPEGFARRVLVTDAAGEPVGRKVEKTQFSGYWGSWGTYSVTVVGSGEITAFRAQNAKDALANHNYIRAVDGESSPINDYQYGVDYELGDLIELQGLTGAIGKARVTEFIRSQDKNGERSYPTISVVA